MVTPLTRRQFLAAGAGVAGAAVLVACGSSGKKDPVVDLSNQTSPSDLNVLVASAQVLVGPDQRVTVGVLKGNDPIAAGQPVQLAVGTPDGKFGPAVAADRHDQGIEDRPYWEIRHTFTAPGNYVVRADVAGATATGAFPVIEPSQTRVPVPGKPLIRVKTPTTTDPAGVNPICTRQPACPWHSVSLDAALDEHRPTVAIFATPAFCKSATCGPVLDNLLAEGQPVQDRVRFVHIDIYTDNTAQTLAPAVQAYGLEFEPIAFFAGPDGIVRERLDGPFDRVEAKAALQRLLS